MSKNARRKLIEKRAHRDAFSRYPKGTPLAFIIRGVEPMSTPLLELISRGQKHG